MSVANLTRYEPNWDESNNFSMAPTLYVGDVYVKFEEAMEASLNSQQSLKSEIAATVKELKVYKYHGGDPEFVRLIDRLEHQLSEV